MLGIIKAQYDWDFARAIVQLGQGAELNPNSAMAHLWMGYVQLQLGQLDLARVEYDKAKELDPLAVNLVWLATWPSFYQRRYDEAIQRLNDVIDLDHGFSDGYALLGETYEQKGDFARALVELRRAESLGSHAWTEVAIGRVYAETGRRDSALRVIDELEERAKKEYVTPYGIATIYAALGDRDHAFEWLEKAFRDRCEDVLLMKVDPRIDRLRADPRFAPLLVRAGLAPRNARSASISLTPRHRRMGDRAPASQDPPGFRVAGRPQCRRTESVAARFFQ